MKRILALLCSVMLLMACVLPVAGLAETAAKTPKYVFLFIGDGMGTPQVTATQYYLGAVQNPDATHPVPAALSFTGFPYSGTATTYDMTSFCPDSASTATAMASGNKTLSGVLNYSVDKTQSYKLITEYAKEAGKKIGVVTSVSLNHATPAAFYAKSESRNNYYDIGIQGLTGTTLDYLAGGAFHHATGDDKDKPQQSLYDVATANGWNYVNTVDGIRALTSDSGRVLAVNPDIQDDDAITYEIDRARRTAAGEDVLSLADFVTAGTKVLDNDNGFFMMCEGGKIDWSCHANDAATTIEDTVAFSNAVQAAVDFAKDHADETLIIVTADHETGGLTIGYATTAYDTHFNYLASQTISFTDFDSAIADMRTKNATFDDALAAIKQYYGLTTEAGQNLSLTEADVAALKAAYTLSMQPEDTRTLTDSDELLYGGYEPLSMAVSHIANNKAGLSYTSYSHTGLPVPVYATGVGAEQFTGMYDDTDLFTKTMSVMGLTK